MEPATSMNEVFHSIRYEHQIRSLERDVLNVTITPRDAQLVREFIAECQSCAGISIGRSN
ncbi:MAG TPA: hypothetical protein PLM96_06530 [Methanoregulaceae archaeon]|nr:hypothetical protein [Methanolinea sp.]MDD3092372.1 hypothetical protein [Methanoregulaceae archaeon]MDD5049564.1 hypothetical protein [Methanoregulaceae archaeon]MDD5684542.1 hypothetical protein [Methanoregulaceae archaeon]HOP66338.1 hypothetical protein [Methanoregulaceae archaeon]